jgi:hypothetical protein
MGVLASALSHLLRRARDRPKTRTDDSSGVDSCSGVAHRLMHRPMKTGTLKVTTVSLELLLRRGKMREA